MTDLNGKKIAIIATDRFEEAELVTPRDELAKAGAEVKIYSAGTDPIQAVEGDTEPTQKVDVDGTSATSTCPRSTRSSSRAARSTPTTSGSTRTPRASCARRWTPTRCVAVICHGPWLLVHRRRREGPQPDQLPSLADRPRERRRHLEGRGGRRRRHPDHQPQPGRPARLRRGDQEALVAERTQAASSRRRTARLQTRSQTCGATSFTCCTGIQPTWTGTPSGPVGGQLLVLDVEEDPHDQRADQHHDGADEEGVGGAVGEGTWPDDVLERRGRLGGRRRAPAGVAAFAAASDRSALSG